jgi:hypothetical protein
MFSLVSNYRLKFDLDKVSEFQKVAICLRLALAARRVLQTLHERTKELSNFNRWLFFEYFLAEAKKY